MDVDTYSKYDGYCNFNLRAVPNNRRSQRQWQYRTPATNAATATTHVHHSGMLYTSIAVTALAAVVIPDATVSMVAATPSTITSLIATGATL